MRYHRILCLLLAACCVAAPAGAWAKPKNCFTKAEQTAEQVVRQGVRLREAARACSAAPWEIKLQPLWEQIDKTYGPRFAQQTAIRKKAFIREFANDANNRLILWDGRIVTFYRYYPLSNEYCTEIKKLMQDTQTKGWSYFLTQSAKARDEVKMDYRPCGY